VGFRLSIIGICTPLVDNCKYWTITGRSPRTVQEFSEDARDLIFNDARPVVLGRNPKLTVFLVEHLDPEFRQDAGLLTGIEGAVDRLLHRRHQRLGAGIETEQVAILQEELLRQRSRAGDRPSRCGSLGSSPSGASDTPAYAGNALALTPVLAGHQRRVHRLCKVM
jgi:hypothetical protein